MEIPTISTMERMLIKVLRSLFVFRKSLFTYKIEQDVTEYLKDNIP